MYKAAGTTLLFMRTRGSHVIAYHLYLWMWVAYSTQLQPMNVFKKSPTCLITEL